MSTNVRVEARYVSHDAPQDQKERAFKQLLANFKRKVNESGVLLDLARKSAYESKGEKTRRKRKESIIKREKEASEFNSKLRDRFGSNSKKAPKRNFKRISEQGTT